MRFFAPYDPPFVSMSSVSGDSLPRGLSALREMGADCTIGALLNSKRVDQIQGTGVVSTNAGQRKERAMFDGVKIVTAGTPAIDIAAVYGDGRQIGTICLVDGERSSV